MPQSTIDLDQFFFPEDFTNGTINCLSKSQQKLIPYFLAGSEQDCTEISNNDGVDVTNSFDPNDFVRAVKIKELGKRDQARNRRENGESYIGYSRELSKIIQNVQRRARHQGPCCVSQFCVKSSRRQCNLFPESERHELFKKFWKMNWSQKHMYICNLIEVVDIKQRKVDATILLK